MTTTAAVSDDTPLILLTGASGYVGGRLLRALENQGARVRCLARRPEALSPRVGPGTEVVSGDVLDRPSLDAALRGGDTAFYLVHSMGSSGSFEEADRLAAANFGQAARAAGVKGIIYLGGLGSDDVTLSAHLRSRQEVGQILAQSGVPVLEFRASIVIGSGSLSFEMIRSLVDRLPIMITPRWVSVRAQPIAIDDLMEYLLAALRLPVAAYRVYEIGGADQVSYADIMRVYARHRGRKLRMIEEAVRRALASDQQQGATHWTDAASSTGKARSWEGVKFGAQLTDSRTVSVAAPPALAFRAIERIGGTTGWYAWNWLWRVRGFLDLLVGGVGTRRGRRSPTTLRIGETLDFWRVDALDQNRRLRLVAEMKLPGRAWLEFEVTGEGGSSTIRQTAIFDPVGLLGKAYWYALFPLHQLVFKGMLRGIAQAALREAATP